MVCCMLHVSLALQVASSVLRATITPHDQLNEALEWCKQAKEDCQGVLWLVATSRYSA